MKNLIEYVKSTSYGTRSLVLVLLALALTITAAVTGNFWVRALSDLAFWASMFFWGAEWLEKKYDSCDYEVYGRDCEDCNDFH